MKIIFALFLVLLAFGAAAQPSTNRPSVMLGWDIVDDPIISGYRIFWGTASRQYTNHVTVIGRTNTLAAVTNLVRATTYYFAATSTATNGLESDYSTEVLFATTPLPPAPVNVRASVLTP